MSSTVDGAGPQGGLHIVVSTTVSDSHTWNLIFLQLLLEEWGHRVTNLGPCVPEELLVSRSAALAPDLIVVSTVNGHGFQDGRRLIEAVRAHPRLAATPVVIGGLLGTGQDGSESGGSGSGGSESGSSGPGSSESDGDRRGIEELLAAGYTAVFHNEAELRRFRSIVDSLRAGVA